VRHQINCNSIPLVIKTYNLIFFCVLFCHF
jgi:hypothetical protein